MDWSASGIRNSYEFERVGFDLETSLGYAEGIVDGEIAENYDGEYRSCLSVEIDGDPLPLDSALRVWRTAELGGEIVREELGTFILQPETMSLNWERGRYTGRASLQSMLYALDTDRRASDRTIKGEWVVVDMFSSFVTNAHCVPALAYELQGSTAQFGGNHMWEFGESVLDECQRCADAVNGYLTADTHGRILMTAYVPPYRRPNSWTLTADDYVDGVGFAQGELVNRVSLRYTYDAGGQQETLLATATVDPASALSWTTIGRNASQTYDVDSLSANTQAALDAKAAQYLSAQTATTRTLAVTMPYAPIPVGSVGVIEVAGIVTRALVSTRSVQLDTEGLMQLGLKEIG